MLGPSGSALQREVDQECFAFTWSRRNEYWHRLKNFYGVPLCGSGSSNMSPETAGGGEMAGDNGLLKYRERKTGVISYLQMSGDVG